MSVAVATLRSPCSKESADPRRTESVSLAGSGWARTACQEQQGGKSQVKAIPVWVLLPDQCITYSESWKFGSFCLFLKAAVGKQRSKK